MDSFAIVIFGGIAGLILWVLLVGRLAGNSSLEQLGLRSARQVVETREALEAEDLDQMLAAMNARRRARGEQERTVEDMELAVMEDQRELRRRRDELMADRELDELLEATNVRRRARGEPERTREDVEREYGAGSSSAS